MGTDASGRPALLDLEELLATRLLVQGNSGSGKSHLLRRLLEESAPWVQQVVIDPEGDFVTLAERHDHIVVEAADYDEGEVARIAAHVRERRASAVLSLEGVDLDAQLRCAAVFLSALFDAPRDHWYPALVVVDEAQLFAPAAAGEISEEARRASLSAMTNLMCRGRKRGLAGVIATQRLAKLAKNVAAEASNFLMGRTFLDIDMARAADLLGMERRQAETIRDLSRGQFLALGPALSRRPVAIGIGPVQTGARSSSPKLIPLPANDVEVDTKAVLAEALRRPPPPSCPEPIRQTIPADDLLRHLRGSVLTPAVSMPSAAPEISADEREAVTAAVLADMVDDAEATFRSPATLYQDFIVRCRIRGLAEAPLDLSVFRRRLMIARAGMSEDISEDPEWRDAMEIGHSLPEDMLGVFLLIARAAKAGTTCPTDEEVARVYGTHSVGRVRRLLGYMEAKGTFVPRIDLVGRRTISIPRLGWTTAPSGSDTRAGALHRREMPASHKQENAS
jgi:energy-coupling factor transporter ATP-binding protein EcfA2